MEISSLFQSDSLEDGRYFLCIIISSTHVQAYLLRFKSKQGAETLAESQIYTYENDKNLVVKTDEALQDLGRKSEDVSEVLFGVDSSWVDDNGLKDDRRDLLHKVAEDLLLEAKGYVMSTEALIHHYTKAATSVAGLVILTSASQIDALVLSEGQVQKHEVIGRSADINADFTELLARVVKWTQNANRQLPPRLMLASLTETASSLEEYRQYLLDLDWQQFPVFLHVPTIELVPPDVFTKIMIQQAALAAQNSGIIERNFNNSHEVVTTDVDNVTPVDSATFASEFNQEANPSFDHQPSPPIKEVSQFKDFHSPGEKKLFSFANLKQKFANNHNTKRKTAPFIALGIILGLITVFLSGLWWISTYSKVVINLQREAKPISAEITATLGKENSGGDQEYTLAATPLSVEVEKTISQQATGTKNVGDPAEGVAIIYNKTEAEKTFVAGTVFTTGDQQFELVNEVTIPKASVTTTEGGGGELKQFGQAEAKLRAKIIGEEGNIPADSKFQVADFSEDTYSAKAKQDFSGGSSREVQVVAQSDHDQLLAQIKKELIKDAKDKIEAQLEKGQFFTEPILSKLTKVVYSADVGEEATTIELRVTATIRTLTYTVDDIHQLAAVVLKDKVPENYQLATEDPEVMSKQIKNDDKKSSDSEQILLKLSAKALPIIDQPLIFDSIKGRSLPDASNILRGRTDIQEASILFNPSVARFVVKKVPQQKERVVIKLLDQN